MSRDEEATRPEAAYEREGEHVMARARIEGRSGTNVSGEATLMEVNDALSIAVRLENAPPGPHGVHIHDVGDCSAPDASSAGGHWNPGGEQHGRRGSESFHAGDIGNVDVGADGTGVITIMAEGLSLEPPGEKSPLGKAVIVHADADDFQTQPDGNAGPRIGCGVIESEGATSHPPRNP